MGGKPRDSTDTTPTSFMKTNDCPNNPARLPHDPPPEAAPPQLLHFQHSSRNVSGQRPPPNSPAFATDTRENECDEAVWAGGMSEAIRRPTGYGV